MPGIEKYQIQYSDSLAFNFLGMVATGVSLSESRLDSGNHQAGQDWCLFPKTEGVHGIARLQSGLEKLEVQSYIHGGGALLLIFTVRYSLTHMYTHTCTDAGLTTSVRS